MEILSGIKVIKWYQLDLEMCMCTDDKFSVWEIQRGCPLSVHFVLGLDF